MIDVILTLGAFLLGGGSVWLAHITGLFNAIAARRKQQSETELAKQKLELAKDREEREARDVLAEQYRELLDFYSNQAKETREESAKQIKMVREESANEAQLLRAKVRELEEGALRQDKRIHDLEIENASLKIRVFTAEERLKIYEQPGRSTP